MSANRWNLEFLNSMRQVGDPLADGVITSILLDHDLDAVDRVLRSLVDNDEIVTADMPPAVLAYLNETATLPDWMDTQLVRQGETFFELNWPVVVMLLFCASLPSAYSAWRGAQVLYLTQRLTQHVQRRIFETAQFILDVMAPDGLQPGGKGVRSAQKVRLLHACMRHYIQHVPKWRDQWDPVWGVPINQEDLAGTLMTFSVEILIGMQGMRLPMTAGEPEAFLHAWKVVGHVMGLDPRLLPADVADAYALATTILDSQRGRSEAGLGLTQALLAFMDQHTPNRLLAGLPATLMRHCLRPGIPKLLEIPEANWTGFLFWLEELILRAADRLESSHPHTSKLLAVYSDSLIQKLVTIERGGTRPLFSIPPTLRARV